MSPAGQSFTNWSIALVAIYLGLALMVNHVMLTGDELAQRAWFYIFVGSVPMFTLGAWRAVRRAHAGTKEQSHREGLVLLSAGLGTAGLVWIATIIFY